MGLHEKPFGTYVIRYVNLFHWTITHILNKPAKIEVIKASNGTDKDCPTTKFSTKQSSQNKDNYVSLGTYGNSWSEQGRKHYCELMKEVNESRAFYKDSFDSCMKKFASAWLLKEKNLRKKQTVTMFDMELDHNLPTHATILQQANNQAAQLLNETLKSHNNEIPIWLVLLLHCFRI